MGQPAGKILRKSTRVIRFYISVTEFIQDTVHPGDRGALQISIPTTGVYSELKLELYDASTGNLVRGKDVCEPITSTLFTGGNHVT